MPEFWIGYIVGAVTGIILGYAITLHAAQKERDDE